MSNTLQIRRGAKTSLPFLNSGEFGFCTDTFEVFIGDGSSNHQLVTHTMCENLGDLIVGSASGTFNILPIATDGYHLVSDSSAPLGVRWDSVTWSDFEAGHEDCLSLNHSISHNYYYELTRDVSNNVTNACYWVSALKLKKIREINYSYNVNNSVYETETIQYDANGDVLNTLTETITYDGNNLVTSITGVRT